MSQSEAKPGSRRVRRGTETRSITDAWLRGKVHRRHQCPALLIFCRRRQMISACAAAQHSRYKPISATRSRSATRREDSDPAWANRRFCSSTPRRVLSEISTMLSGSYVNCMRVNALRAFLWQRNAPRRWSRGVAASCCLPVRLRA